ncbi:MAG: 30S ribosomal protein S18 [Omnitrophica bacterium GWA2_52_8]|nr:MAG: 30S ribosomal protein S18 [Omnitrophica bacterium GWA2_52_8]
MAFQQSRSQSSYGNRDRGGKPGGSNFRKFRPGGSGGPGMEGPGGRVFRKKINRFHVVFSENPDYIDYKDTERLSKFLTEKGKIVPRRITALTSKQQRLLVRAIKRARHSGLLAFQVG